MNPRLSLWVVIVAAIVLGSSTVRADDPPDRLEKKPAPADRKAPVPPKPDATRKEKPKDGAPAEDAEKLREKIAEDMQSAEKKLKNHDPGHDTQELQDRALRNIDKLIDLARNPPPPPPEQPPTGGSPPPMGGSPPPNGGQQQSQGGQAQPQGGQPKSQSSQSRRRRREQRRKQMEQQGRAGGPPLQLQTEPHNERGGIKTQNSAAQPGMAGPNADRQPDHLSDVVKDFWGHLPETLRQDVDHYYRDRFMPRYRDLLREYYGRIAERDRTPSEDR